MTELLVETLAGVEETILGSGDVVQIGSQGVKSIPLSPMPKPLQGPLQKSSVRPGGPLALLSG